MHEEMPYFSQLYLAGMSFIEAMNDLVYSIETEQFTLSGHMSPQWSSTY